MSGVNTELGNITFTLEEIQGSGMFNSVTDIHDKLVEFQGHGLHNFGDIIEVIEELKGGGLFNTISDLHDKLDSIQGLGFNSIADVVERLD